MGEKNWENTNHSLNISEVTSFTVLKSERGLQWLGALCLPGTRKAFSSGLVPDSGHFLPSFHPEETLLQSPEGGMLFSSLALAHTAPSPWNTLFFLLNAPSFKTSVKPSWIATV